MKKKTLGLISVLVANADYMTATELAKSLGMSRRSVMYELDVLDKKLALAGLSVTERVTNRGIRIVPKDRRRVEELAETSTIDEILDFTDRRDRRFFLLFSFLCVGGGATTESLCEQMAVSSRTVSNDIRTLRELLAKQGLELMYDKKGGYAIEGNAFTVRNLLVKWLMATCPTGNSDDFAASLEGLYAYAGSSPDGALGAAELSSINRMLDEVIPNRYTNNAMQALYFHLVAVLMCSSHTEGVGIADADKGFLERSVSFDVARIVCLRAQEITGIQIDWDEGYYMATLLQSLPIDSSGEACNASYPFEIEVVAQTLILDVSEAYQYDFNTDPELFRILVDHMIPLVYRVLFNCQSKNPLLGEIVDKYARLNEAVRGCLVGIEAYAGSAVTDDECSYLTLYFASSVEKMSNKIGDKARVVVVCNAGNAVSRLLQYRLTNMFNVDVVASVSEADVYGVIASGLSVDLIVTVADLDESRLGAVQYLKVNALLGDEDMGLLRRRLRQRVFLKPEPASQGASLTDLLAPSCFEVLTRVRDMDGLIEAGGRLLCRAGLCDEEYPSQMVSTAHLFGPLTTILIAPGIIMPHAGISDHVYRTGFSFVRVREPVMVNGSRVTCALSLCTRSKNINQRAIQQFGLLLGRSSFMDHVNNVETYDQLVSLIDKCLEEAERK